MYYIKYLSADNWMEVKEKLDNISVFRIGQTKEEMDKDLYYEYTKNSLHDDKDKVLGFYLNDELTSITTVSEFNFMPAYLIKNFRHFGKSNLYNPLQNGLGPFLDFLINFYEKQHIYTFYMVKTANAKRINQVRVRNLLLTGAPSLKKYELTVEELIKAGTKSTYRVHSEAVCLGHVFQHDVIIMRWSCRQEFRTYIGSDLMEKMLGGLSK